MPDLLVPDLENPGTGTLRPWVSEGGTGVVDVRYTREAAWTGQSGKFAGGRYLPRPATLFRFDRSLTRATASTGSTPELDLGWQVDASNRWSEADAAVGPRPITALESTALDDLGAFIMLRISEGNGSLSVAVLDEHVDGAEGWLAIARLLRSDLIKENGVSIFLTERGEFAVSELRADLGLD